MNFTWGAEAMEEREEAANDQKAEYMNDFYRERVTNDEVMDALGDLYLADGFCEEIAVNFRSLDEEKIGKAVIRFLEQVLKDEAESHAETMIEDHANAVRGML